MAFWNSLLPLVSSWEVFDNSVPDQGRRIASGDTQGNQRIEDIDAWQTFLGGATR